MFATITQIHAGPFPTFVLSVYGNEDEVCRGLEPPKRWFPVSSDTNPSSAQAASGAAGGDERSSNL